MRSGGPLQGLRVLDLSRMVAGGLAGMLLADFGADVVKVEHPRTGDPLRQWTADGVSYWWQVYARNKRFITLDLKSPDGRALLERLVPKFDVIIESFVPGTLEAMGLDWPTLSRWNRRLILARISGWGQSGPGRDRPGFGTLVEAASGFAAMNGEDGGPPLVPAYPMADMSAGLYAVNAVNRHLALRIALLAARSPARRIRHARPGADAPGQPIEELGAPRLFSYERQRLDCRERIDAQDGRALPEGVWPGTPACRSPVCDERSARQARRRAERSPRERHRRPHAR
jgi:hypothetical protein